MITLTLIRHAATAFNDDGRYQGQCDPDLSTRGVSQAQALARRLTEQCAVFDSVWASDRRRAWRTAAIALPDAMVRRAASLRELDFGVFDGLSYGENLARYPHRFPAWMADPWHVRPPSGETLAELTTRVAAWVAQLAPGQNVVAFTHAGPIQVLLARALGVSFAEAQRIPVGPCGVMRLRLNADRALTTLPGPREERRWP
jgi:broad specificity phosphatase PhoE